MSLNCFSFLWLSSGPVWDCTEVRDGGGRGTDAGDKKQVSLLSMCMGTVKNEALNSVCGV